MREGARALRGRKGATSMSRRIHGKRRRTTLEPTKQTLIDAESNKMVLVEWSIERILGDEALQCYTQLFNLNVQAKK